MVSVNDVLQIDRGSWYFVDHVFLTFPTSNEVRVENCDFHTVEELRQHVLPSWPAGVGQEGMNRHEPVWIAQFNGTPWATSSTSPDSIMCVYCESILHAR